MVYSFLEHIVRDEYLLEGQTVLLSSILPSFYWLASQPRDQKVHKRDCCKKMSLEIPIPLINNEDS
jgi:cbb3-type cytochrome oxidase cytochrome c subunit